MDTQHIIAFASYFLVLLSIGIYSHRAQNTSKDFIMGNRSLSFWVTAFSAHASDMSGWLFMAFPAALFIGGLPNIWIGLGLLGGMFLNWQFVATKLRIETEKYESYTLSSYFENKFNDTSGAIRILTAAMAVIFLTFYLSAGLIAMGYLLESLFHIDYYLGLTIAMLVAMTYTFVGGYYTVAKVDQFQAIFLLLVIVLVPIVAIFSMDSPIDSILNASHEHNISLSIFYTATPENILATIFLILSWGLGYFGQPHIITKFMGIDCPENLRKSKYVGMTWQITTLLAAASIGIVGIGFFEGQLSNPELVFVNMVQSLFPPLLAGFILCGVLAANMSTMDSQILVCASVLSEDFYKHIVKKHASEKELLIVSRIGVILTSIISLFIAFIKSSTVLDAVLYAWSGLGSSFGPLILMSLYFKKCNKYGAISGILVGGIVAGIWPHLNAYLGIPYIIPGMIPGFILSTLSIYTVSLLTNEKS
ncbi:MAG: sodium/proline symporter [Chlamydiota bacterium]|nr:sodium/proline symporter [Chlamydiota bacterium]